MRHRTTSTNPARAGVLLLALTLAGGCGGESTGTTPETQPSAGATDHPEAEDTAASGHPDGEGAAASESAGAHDDGRTGADGHAGAAGGADDSAGAAGHDGAGGAAALPLEEALASVAASTAGALSGPDWGAVYDLSCPALRSGQSREAYVAGLSKAGSPAQLAAGTLSVGDVVEAGEADAAELPAAEGETRWVQLRQGEGILGVARFVDAGEGYRYCGLTA